MMIGRQKRYFFHAYFLQFYAGIHVEPRREEIGAAKIWRDPVLQGSTASVSVKGKRFGGSALISGCSPRFSAGGTAYFGESNRSSAWAHGIVENTLKNWGWQGFSPALKLGPFRSTIKSNQSYGR
jgi:hypothetical protein